MVVSGNKKEKTITIKVVDRLKESLVSEGLITQDQLQAAEKEVKQKNKILGRVLVDSGYVTEEKLLNFIGDKVHIPYVDISKYTIDLNVLKIIPERIARFYNILPLFEIEKVLTVAMSDPVDIISCDEISKVIKYEIDPVLAPDESIKEAINRWYSEGVEKKDLIDKLAEELKSIVEEKEPEELYGKQLDEIRLRKEAEEAPIIKLVNSIIVQAVLENASDIHIEPKKDRLEVRYRIDGFLYNRHKLPFRLIPTIISRIKILSGMDISKRRTPQDGRMSFIVRNKNINVRTSSFPTMYGENVVLRILDTSEGIPKLSELGFSNENFNTLKKILKSSYGLILIFDSLIFKFQ